MKSTLTFAAAAFAASLAFALVSPAQAQAVNDTCTTTADGLGPHGMFQCEPGGGGNPNRDICGTSSVQAHALTQSNGNAKVGLNGSPQWFQGTTASFTCGPDGKAENGRCNGPQPNSENGLGHIGDDNCGVL